MRSLLATVALVAFSSSAMAGDSGKLTAPPERGWQAAIDAVRFDLPSSPAAAPPRAQPAASQTAQSAAPARPHAPQPRSVFQTGAAAGTAVALADNQIADKRGGFSGMNFSMFFAGHVESLGQTEGQFAVGSNVPTPSFSMNDGTLNVQTHIGDFGSSSGIFQIVQNTGDFNVINQNLFVQINLLNRAFDGQLTGF